jgi:hypothetical protein
MQFCDCLLEPFPTVSVVFVVANVLGDKIVHHGGVSCSPERLVQTAGLRAVLLRQCPILCGDDRVFAVPGTVEQTAGRRADGRLVSSLRSSPRAPAARSPSPWCPHRGPGAVRSNRAQRRTPTSKTAASPTRRRPGRRTIGVRAPTPRTRQHRRAPCRNQMPPGKHRRMPSRKGPEDAPYSSCEPITSPRNMANGKTKVRETNATPARAMRRTNLGAPSSSAKYSPASPAQMRTHLGESCSRPAAT